MIKQIDRVIGDLVRQVEQFKSTGGNPICVGLVGVNFASRYTGYEGAVEWPTDGKNTSIRFQRRRTPNVECLLALLRLLMNSSF